MSSYNMYYPYSYKKRSKLIAPLDPSMSSMRYPPMIFQLFLKISPKFQTYVFTYPNSKFCRDLLLYDHVIVSVASNEAFRGIKFDVLGTCRQLITFCMFSN